VSLWYATILVFLVLKVPLSIIDAFSKCGNGVVVGPGVIFFSGIESSALYLKTISGQSKIHV